MASSDTLSVFVPNAGDPPAEQMINGARVVTTSDGFSTIFPNAGKFIQDVGVQVPTSGDTDTTFKGPSRDTSFIGNDDDNTVTYSAWAKDATVSTGDGSDIFSSKFMTKGDISLGEGDNEVDIAGTRRTSISSGSGDDTFNIDGNVKALDLDTGSGDDSLLFGGNVFGSSIKLGDGADFVEFSSLVRNTEIDLGKDPLSDGPDSYIDTITFSSKDDILKGTRIVNAGEGDQLIIGGEEYVFDANQSAFISNTDPNDSITFG